mgnify:CR=1 FL=1
MKNIIAIALALCLACLPALGEAAREGIMLDVDGSSVTLNFDSSAEYSSVYPEAFATFPTVTVTECEPEDEAVSVGAMSGIVSVCAFAVEDHSESE